jgi:hypothetical protein
LVPGDDDAFQFRQNEIRIFPEFPDDVPEVSQDGVGNVFVTQPLHLAEKEGEFTRQIYLDHWPVL